MWYVNWLLDIIIMYIENINSSQSPYIVTKGGGVRYSLRLSLKCTVLRKHALKQLLHVSGRIEQVLP